MIPAQHCGAQVLVNMEGATMQSLHGQAHAIATWDSGTGMGELRAKGWGNEVTGPSSLNATGLFFEGSHQPNGTVSGVMPDGGAVKVIFFCHTYVDEGLTRVAGSMAGGETNSSGRGLDA